MKIKVLDRASLGADTPLEGLYELGEVEIYDKTEPAEALTRCADADIIILNKVKITREVIFAARHLKLVCVFATGFDNIDISAARERGVAVCNVPGYSTESVALFTVSKVLALATHLREYSEFVRSGEYTASGVPNRLVPVYHELCGLTWGIVGYGAIGRAVGRIARALGANVIVNKRTPVSDAECVGIEELCQRSDIITLHCPLNDGTREIINEKTLSMMKKNAILVNEARGAVVCERAVTDAIKGGKIAGFGCDVYSKEPFGADHPYNEILGYDNVIFTPHAAWGAYEARVRCINIIIDNIKAFLDGKIQNRVDK